MLFFLITLSIYSATYGVSLFFNHFVEWYYGLGYLLSITPLIVGTTLFVINMGADTKSGRSYLTTGVMLSIFAILLNWLWEMIYVNAFLKTKYYYQGVGDADEEANYFPHLKNSYLTALSIVDIILLFWLVYFMSCTNTWAQAAKKDKDGKPPAKADQENVAQAPAAQTQ